jgi:hypothetical protein
MQSILTKAPRIVLGLRLLALLLALAWLPSGRVDFASYGTPQLSVTQRAPEAAIAAHRPLAALAEAKVFRGSPNKTALPGQPAIFQASDEYRAIHFTRTACTNAGAGLPPRSASYAQARAPPAWPA